MLHGYARDRVDVEVEAEMQMVARVVLNADHVLERIERIGERVVSHVHVFG